MDETDVVMTYVKDEIQAQIDTKIAQMISEAKEDMQAYIKQQLETPRIIGEKASHKTFSDWVKYITGSFRQLPDQIDGKVNEVRQTIEDMKIEAEASEARRDKINKEKLDKVIEDISKDQQDKFEEMKAGVERTLRESNLEVDTRFKERLDNLKDSFSIEQQSINKELANNNRIITSVQEKVFDINSFKLKEISDIAKEANEISRRSINDTSKMVDNKFEAYEKRINEAFEKIEKLDGKIASKTFAAASKRLSNKDQKSDNDYESRSKFNKTSNNISENIEGGSTKEEDIIKRKNK